MTKQPVFMTDLPNPDPVPGPAGTDLLSDALRQLRMTGAALLRGDFTSPWSWSAPPSASIGEYLGSGNRRLMLFHIVTEGECWIDVEGQPRVHLQAGELVALPHGDAHHMGRGNAPPVPVASLFPTPPWVELPAFTYGGGGELTRIVCTYLSFDVPVFNPLLSSLPRVMVVRRADGASREWIRTSINYLVDDTVRGQSGASFLLDRLTELLFLEMIRLHLAGLPASQNGWLAALRDRYIARALHLLHTRMAEPWSIDRLANEVGLSRSPLEMRFSKLLGLPAMRYLTLWRLQRAAVLLSETQQPVATVAGEIGYTSEEAFSRAFKRHTGRSPSAWRRIGPRQGEEASGGVMAAVADATAEPVNRLPI